MTEPPMEKEENVTSKLKKEASRFKSGFLNLGGKLKRESKSAYDYSAPKVSKGARLTGKAASITGKKFLSTYSNVKKIREQQKVLRIKKLQDQITEYEYQIKAKKLENELNDYVTRLHAQRNALRTKARGETLISKVGKLFISSEKKKSRKRKSKTRVGKRSYRY